MKPDKPKPDEVLRGPIFTEPVQATVVIPMGEAVKLIAKSFGTGKVYEPILTPDKLADLQTMPDSQPFDGEPQRFRLAVEAMRLAELHERDLGVDDPLFAAKLKKVEGKLKELNSRLEERTAKMRREAECMVGDIQLLQDSATLDWQPIVKIDHYRLKQDSAKRPVELKGDAPPYKTKGSQ